MPVSKPTTTRSIHGWLFRPRRYCYFWQNMFHCRSTYSYTPPPLQHFLLKTTSNFGGRWVSTQARRIPESHGYFTPSCVWDISMRSVASASEWLRYSGCESKRVSVWTWYRFVCIYTFIGFNEGLWLRHCIYLWDKPSMPVIPSLSTLRLIVR